jgi:ERF superfamily protein
MPRTRAAAVAKDDEPVVTPTNVPIFTGEHQLAAKLAYITGEVAYIEKRGINPHFKYRFVREADLKARISPLMAVLGVALVAEVVSHERVARAKSDMTVLTVRWHFHDGVTGEEFVGTSVGYGDDSGDKGANKAMTAALKFFLMTTFLVASGDDSEADVETDKRAADNRPIQITSSSAPQAERGGHTDKVTSAQLMEVSNLSLQLDLGPLGVRDAVERILGISWDLPEDGDPALLSKSLAALLVQLGGDQIGKLIGALQEQVVLLEDLKQIGEVDTAEADQADMGLSY